MPIPTRAASSLVPTQPSAEPPKRASAPIRCDDDQKCFYIDAFGLSYRIPKDAKIAVSGHEAAAPLWPHTGGIEFIPLEKRRSYRPNTEEFLAAPTLCIVRVDDAPRAECPPALTTSWIVGEFNVRRRVGVGIARVSDETWNFLQKRAVHR